VSFLLGQMKGTPDDTELYSMVFPEGLASDFLYPETSVVYTKADGTTYDVSCFAYGVMEVPKVDCPYPFVNPLSSENVQGCIQPCPVQAYTEDEYTSMWRWFNGIGMVGLILNLYMAATYALAGKKQFSKTPYQLKFCVFGGILYGVVGTLPSLVMKYDLPCSCTTEEWYALSLACIKHVRRVRVRVSG
jgi:hypothetical protein